MSMLQQRAMLRLSALKGWAWAFVAMSLCASGLVLAYRPFNPDVSWGLTLGERILRGEKLYRDIIETNPPMTAFLYLPTSVFARALNLKAEYILIFEVGVVFVLAVSTASRVLKATATEGGRPLFVALSTICAWVVWLNSFAEREHLATIALLPFFAVWQARAQRRPVHLLSVIAAGFGGGLATAIKPYFCLCLILPALCAVFQRRDLRAAFALEYWIAAAVAFLYLVVILLFYPVYAAVILPMLRDTYLAYKLSAPELLFRPEWFLCLSWIILLFLVRPNWIKAQSWGVAALLAGIGFFICYMIQAKGYTNHMLGGVSLIALGTVGLMAPSGLSAVRDPAAPLLKRGVTLVGMAWVAVTLAALTIQMDRPLSLRSLSLLEPIGRLPAARTLLTVSPDLDMGHPLARSAGLRYVGSVPSLWLAGSAMRRRSQPNAAPRLKAQMDRYIALDLRRLCRDIAVAKPDLIVFDSAGISKSFLKRQAPGAFQAISGYALVAASNGVELLKRRPVSTAPNCGQP